MTQYEEKVMREFEEKFRHIGNIGVACDHVTLKNLKSFLLQALQKQREDILSGLPKEKHKCNPKPVNFFGTKTFQCGCGKYFEYGTDNVILSAEDSGYKPIP